MSSSRDSGAADGGGLPDATIGSVDTSTPDAGRAPDAGGPPDAGPALDAGPAPDAGSGYFGCPTACQNAHGTADCTKGSCVVSCATGFANCDGSTANGCETDLSADPNHCGQCALACDANSERCADGTCELSPCSTGKGECDGNTAAACETDLTSSAANCGFCGNVCSTTQASAGCSASACGIVSCNSGYDDCDGQYANGCETSLMTSVGNCGGCGDACVAAGGGSAICNAGTCESHCDLNGVFALKMLVPTTWPSTSVLSSGTGTFVVWAKLQITHSGTQVIMQTTPCGQTVPDFSAAAFINEKYGATYPTPIFDRMPPPASVSGTGSLSGTILGSSFSITRTAWMVGLTMSDPLNGAWPSNGAIMQVDADADSKVGVTLNYKSGSGYSNPPANSLGSTRANRVYMAARMVFSLSGTLSSCNAWSGAASVQDVDSHSIGCRTTDDGDCNNSEYNYLDSNAPNYQTQPATFAVSRLSNSAVCSNVRAALP